MKIFLRLTAILALFATSALANPGHIAPKPAAHPIVKEIRTELIEPPPGPTGLRTEKSDD